MDNFAKILALGEALHGPHWQNAVARDLEIDNRRVHRWAKGEGEPHDGHVSDLLDVAEDRKRRIAEAINFCTKDQKPLVDNI